MASEKPIIIPELLKELVYKEIENSNILKEKTLERSKLAQKCYLASLKLIKSHIVSGVKECSFENPLEDAHELLLGKGRSTQVHKLNRLYEKLSNLSLAIPELNCPSKYLGSNSSSEPKTQNNAFQDQFLRLLIPLFDTGSRDNNADYDHDHQYDDDHDGQENLGTSFQNVKSGGDLQSSITPVLSRFKDQNTQQQASSSFPPSGEDFAIQARGISSSIYKRDNGNDLEVYKKESSITESHDSYSVPLFVLEKCLLSPTQELALVHDILYALQGFDAQFVKYDISTDSYILHPSVYSLETTRELVTEICHFGTIYKRMTQVLSYHKKRLESPCLMETSMLTKTLIEFTQDLLEEYSQFIVSQQNEVQESMIALSKLDAGANPNLELLSSNKPMLTLRKLLSRINDQYHRKEKVLAVLEGLFGQTSSSILSCLNIHRRSGNQYHEKVFENLFHKCLSVWLQDLNMILRHGTSRRYLDDNDSTNLRSRSRIDFENKMGEFFVKGNLREGIKIDESRVPSFLMVETAHQITHLCETRITIKALLSQYEDARLAEELGIHELTSEVISDLNSIPLHTALNRIQHQLDTKLKELVVGQGFLVSHLKAIRDYLICFNGDFSDLLIRSMEGELDKPSESVSVQSLEEIFEDVIRTCRMPQSFEGSFRVSLFDDQMYKSKPGSSGWDIFTLDFLLPERSRLSLILTPSHLARYQRIFKTVWKLKLVVHKLNSTWSQLVKYLRCNELCILPDSADAALLRQSSCLVRALIVSLNTIQGLLSFSSISRLWSSLEDLLPEAESIYQIQNLHNAYISGIESNLFISSSSPREQKISQDIYLCLDLILESSLFLCKINKTLLNNHLLAHESGHHDEDNCTRRVPGSETNDIVSSLRYEIYESSQNFKKCFKSLHTSLGLLLQLKHENPDYDPSLQLQIHLLESLLEQLSLNFRFLD